MTPTQQSPDSVCRQPPLFMRVHICLEKPAEAEPALPVKCAMFANGFANGVTPTTVQFCLIEEHRLI